MPIRRMVRPDPLISRTALLLTVGVCCAGLWPSMASCGLGGPASGPAAGGAQIVAIGAVRPQGAGPGRQRTVFLDAGHGGIDWGGKARTPDGTWVAEKTFTLDLALRTAVLLRSAGYAVVLARSEDPGPDRWAANNPARDLNGDGEIDGIDDVQARINIANDAHADVLLSIHLNGHSLPNGEIDPTFSGVTTLFDPDRPFSAENRRLAVLVHQQTLDIMTSLLGHAPRDWGVTDDTQLATPFTTSHTSYTHDVEIGPSEPHWVTASTMPGVISEPLFLSSPEEQAIVLREEARQNLALGYLRAIDAFFGRSP
ncbi:MAG TPA: N-acetylmuramoyl-L-alanine amidase [Chloroflexota bacterium]